jgi:4'-phosphopantetheinyl transferase
VPAAISCELWWARPSSARPGARVLLDDAERARLARFRRPEDAARFLAAHALLRVLVGRTLGVSPGQIGITARCPHCGGPHGKPTVPDAPGLELSLSHSGGWVVVALARGAPVGVDVELLRPLADLDALAERVRSPAERDRGDGDGSDGLLRTWTRKEALLKASGDGLAVPMADLTLSPPGAAPRLIDWAGRPANGAAWLADLAPDGEHVGCVALLGVPSAQLTEQPADALLVELA